MTRINASICSVCIVLAVGCSEPAYVPDITLVQSGPIIDATAEFHGLYPSFALLSGKENFGVDAPKVKKIEPSELSSHVEAELLKKLDSAGVFSRVTAFHPDPDLIVSGRINALHEHYRPQIWSQVPIPGLETVTQMLRMKTHVSSGKVDLTLFVMKPNGKVVGSYTGQSTFRETFNPTADVPPGARLNRALSEAVQQIQEKISRDAHLRQIALR